MYYYVELLMCKHLATCVYVLNYRYKCVYRGIFYITDCTHANSVLRSYCCKRVVFIELTNNLKFFINCQHFSLTFFAQTSHLNNTKNNNNGSHAQQLDIKKFWISFQVIKVSDNQGSTL